MRRSAAPSKAGNFTVKRAKFTPPAIVTANQPLPLSPSSSSNNFSKYQKCRVEDENKKFDISVNAKLFTSVISSTTKTDYSITPNDAANVCSYSTSKSMQKSDGDADSDATNSNDYKSMSGSRSDKLDFSINTSTKFIDNANENLVKEAEQYFPQYVKGNNDLVFTPVQREKLDVPIHHKTSSSFCENAEKVDALKQMQTVCKQSPTAQDQPEMKTSHKYFSVMWCKMSKKKHKKWEGDAVLVTTGRTASLYDMESKIIGKGTGYKVAELESLKEDETLFIGGKEIQVMSELTEDQFKSGKCFSGSGSTETVSTSTVTGRRSLPGFKPFANPVMKNGGSSIKSVMTDKSILSSSRFDPSVPGALVMLRPGTDHQWRNNKQGQVVIDVVVDPYIASYLRPHQREGVAFLYECVMGLRDFNGQGAVLADDMGLGKTLQCIALIWTLLKQGPYGGKPVAKKVIVITPGSLVKNWFMEFKKWLGVERLNVYAVSSDKKVQGFVKSGNHPVLVISYEMFVRYYDDLKQVTFDMIICDEGHRLKNTAIKTTSLIMSLSSKRRVVLTGTPVQNDLQEFFAIMEFCNPGILGTSAAFRRVYEEPIVASRQPEASAEQKELGLERASELTRLTHMFVLRRTQEVNNDYLPPKVELVLFCRPSELQLSLYRQLIRSNLIRRCLSGNLSGSPHLICIGALKQLCNHPGLMYRKAAEAQLQKLRHESELVGEDKRGAHHNEPFDETIYDGLLSYFPGTFDASTVLCEDSGKLEVLSQILSSVWKHSSTEKVVIVSNHTKTLDFLQVFCDLHNYTYLRLDGQTPTAQRQDIVNKFNQKFSPQRIFLLSSKAGGVGLNLIGASRLILYDIDWNPANDLQAMARVWRDGQSRKVHIYRLLTVGTIEEKIYQRQVTKQGLSETVMDICSKNNVMFSLEDLRDLFSLNEKTDCETHTMLSCECGGDPDYEAPAARQDEDQEEVDNRACQLGNDVTTMQKNSSNLTMAELLQWKHWRGINAREVKSWYLDETGDAVSFVFWHEIDNTVV